jgi:4-amino-4-deoxy-L-arabinose transferase-like glycosyltransferase
MDDVDAAEALQAKNMLLSGDWVTQHLNGTLYLDKAPLKYWITCCLYSIFGIHDWVARIPTALAAILLCWLVVRIGRRAVSPEVGFYSGLVLATSIGLYLFTRTIIPDIILTLLITSSLWCVYRSLESEKSRLWSLGASASIGLAVLTKGLIGVFFPVAIAVVYLLVSRSNWRRLHPFTGLIVFLVIVAPWHILASLHNPPVWDFTLHAGPHFGGKFRGFFWFYFINEQLLRFLNERWPRDYNTVPRLWFWLSQPVWFFPWCFALPAIFKMKFTRFHMFLVCWIAVVMLFFTLSTTQEYYSMPIYPAVAIMIGSALAVSSKWLRFSSLSFVVLAAAVILILVKVWSLPAPGDIYQALAQHPDLYTLSLGHMADLTLPAFAYLKLPLALAGAAFLLGGLATLFLQRKTAYVALALSLVLFFQAARLALVVFNPYLSSQPVAQKLNQLPKGLVAICGKYNPLSSLFFYSHDGALQNEDDLDILEYGSLGSAAPKITVTDEEMKQLWDGPERIYIVAKAPKLHHLEEVLGDMHPAFQSGDKYLFIQSH